MIIDYARTYTRSGVRLRKREERREDVEKDWGAG